VYPEERRMPGRQGQILTAALHPAFAGTSLGGASSQD
jgi:hypothetical protein